MQSPSNRTADRLLRRMCARSSVPYSCGARLLPLVQRALAADGALRRALLDVVVATLARDACDFTGARAEERLLAAVASAFHPWGDPH